MDDPVGVDERDRVDAVDGVLGLERAAYERDLLFRNDESRVERAAARLPEPDRRGLVPDDVVRPEDLDQQDE